MKVKTARYRLHFIWSIATFLLSILTAHSQELKHQEKLTQADSITFNSYRQKVVEHINPNPDSALFYIRQMELFSRQKNYRIGLVDSEYTLGHYYRRIQKMDSAIIFYRKSEEFAKQISYKSGIARALNALCRGHYLVGASQEAKEACNECLRVADPKEDLHIIVDTYTALGNAYMRENDFKAAVNYFLKADSIHLQTPQRPDIIAASYQSLGNVYKELKDYPKAIEYYTKASEEFKKLPVNTDYFVNNTNMQLGTVYYLQKNIESADSTLSLSQSYFEKIGDENALAQINTYLGLTRLEQGKLEDAEALLEDGYQMNLSNQFKYEATEAQLKLAGLFLAKKNPEKAIFHLQGVLQNNQGANKSIEAEALKNLSEAYFLQGDYSQAYSLLEKAGELKDSISQVQNQTSIRELETIYETEQKEREIALLRSESQLTSQKQKNQRNMLLGIIGMTSLAGLFLFFLYKNRQKTNTKLLKLDEVKSNFFTNISHELRTPIALIKGPIEQQLGKNDLEPSEQNNLLIAQKNTDRLQVLVDQILDLSKLEAGEYKLLVSEDNIRPFLKSLLNSFEYLAAKKNQQYQVDIDIEGALHWFDVDIIQKIITNLLSNAIKYSPENSEIAIYVKGDTKAIELSISNSGTALTKEELNNIFKRYYRSNEDQTGTGIGLALTKDLVELHKGSISVSSQDEKVSFKVKLPLSKSAFSPQQIATDSGKPYKLKDLNDETTEEVIIIEDSKINKDTPILLVVDDNEDIRSFVSSLFENEFQIITAENGNDGYKMAKKLLPNVIITDLMMPGEDGLTLCRNCKTDDTTSHIPIIMLTAKAGDENHLIGLETGADAYLTKPFNIEILKQNVFNVLENQKRLQARFSKEVILTPKEISVNSYDERFLTSLQKILDNELTKSDFTAEKFAQTLGMSRMQLHRKLKALTGQTATEFIRSQRLKLAADLLKSSQVNVSEIGYTVGFNNHSYFTQCFKNQFGVSPIEYTKIA